VIALALLGIFAAIAGQGITGLWRGLLIDERNKISLSRLQRTLWTIVVLSGFLTAALSNLEAGQPDPLAISAPSELWLLMGISTTSLVASPLIKSTKRSVEANEGEKNHTFALLAKQMNVESIQESVESRGQRRLPRLLAVYGLERVCPHEDANGVSKARSHQEEGRRCHSHFKPNG
jgi:hypothetical protein